MSPQSQPARPVVRRFSLSSLRAKLIVPYALLTLLTAMVGVYIITRLVAASVHERFVNQLYQASRVAADGVVRQERSLLENLRVLAFTDGVPQALSVGDRAALRDRLAPIALNYNLQVVIAVDRSGREIITLARGEDITRNQLYADIGLVRNVLQGVQDDQGDKFAGLLETPDGYFLMISSPVRDAAGEVVGAMLVGVQLKSLLDDLKLQALADILVLLPTGRMAATTLAGPDDGFGAVELPGVDLEAASPEIRDVRLYNRSYQVLYTPLQIRSRSAAMLGVVLASDYVFATETTSRDGVSLIFALGTGAIIVVGYALSQSIARPILRLRSISQDVAAGNLDQQSGLSRTDEIGELAAAFDVMTLRLRERTAEAARLYAESVRRNEELVSINAQLQATQQQLIQSEKLAAIGQLTAGIVHDVRNPLAVIKGTAEVLHDDFDMDSEIKKHLAAIRDSAGRANKIVNDLLKFARQSTPEMQHRDLKETVEAALRLTTYVSREARVKVIQDLPESAVLMTYDAQQIEQVLINLIQNAVQAMPEGGTLRVSLSPVNGAAAIAVQDTGMGIPPDNLRRIFDPFFTTKPEGEGTGLGLSVSYGIISRHGGQINVESQVGVGTTFTILLPSEPPQAAAAPAEVNPA